MTDNVLTATDWFAVQVKPPANHGRRTTVVGATFETYKGRDGQVRKRAIRGSGQRVNVAELLLRRAGFSVFLPIKQEWRRVSRYDKQQQLVSYPLLASWIFVGWSCHTPRWQDLIALDVVTGIAGNDGRPIRISGPAMKKMMQVYGGGRLAPDNQRYMRAHHEYSKGDLVRVDYGPLLGQEVVIVDIAAGKARALMQFMGAGVAVELDADTLSMVK